MEQPDLFSWNQPPPARKADTSQAAAGKMQRSANTIRLLVYQTIKAMGAHGATSKEVSDAMGIPYEAVQPRTSELKKAGRIFDSGERRASRAEDKQAIVWKAV